MPYSLFGDAKIVIILNDTNYLHSFLVLIRMAATLAAEIRRIKPRAVAKMMPCNEDEIFRLQASAL
jgi:hypothetical protein